MASTSEELLAQIQDVVDKQQLNDLVARPHRGFDRLDDELIVSSLALGFRYDRSDLSYARGERDLSAMDAVPEGLGR